MLEFAVLLLPEKPNKNEPNKNEPNENEPNETYFFDLLEICQLSVEFGDKDDPGSSRWEWTSGQEEGVWKRDVRYAKHRGLENLALRHRSLKQVLEAKFSKTCHY